VRHTYDEDTNHRFVVSSDETFHECECTLERSDVAYTVNYSCTDISIGQTQYSSISNLKFRNSKSIQGYTPKPESTLIILSILMQ